MGWNCYSGKKEHTETRYVSLSFFILVNFEFWDRLKSPIHFFIIQSRVTLSSLDCLWFFLNFQEQTMTVRGNAALWLAHHFMSSATVHFNTMPGERQRNSTLLLTRALRFICGTKMKFDQINLEVLAIRTEVIRTHWAQSSFIPLASWLALFLQAAVSSTVGQ